MNTLARSTLASLAVAACFLLPGREARADIYEDALAVIGQLVQDNIAQEVIPNAARVHPVICGYFPSTVHAIEMKRYDGLRAVVQKEAADAIGLTVYDEVSKLVAYLGNTTDPTVVGVLKTSIKRVGSQQLNPLEPVAPGVKPALDTAPCSAAYDVNTNAGKMFEGKESKASVTMRNCGPQQDTLDHERSCAVALLVRDAANGDKGALGSDVRRIAAAMTAGIFRAKLYLKNGDAGLVKAAASVAAFLTASATNTISDDDIAKDVCTVLGMTPPTPANPTDHWTPCLTDVKGTLAVLRSAKADPATFEQALGLISTFASNPDVCDPNDPHMRTSDCWAPTNEERPAACKAAPAPTPPATCAPACVVTVCDKISHLATSAQTVVKDVAAKNYGNAAAAAFDAVQELGCGTDTSKPGCTKLDKLVYAFLRALAVYSVDSLTSGSSGGSPYSGSFRQAAVDLIEASSGLGIRRRLSVDMPGPGWALLPGPGSLVPEFALRGAYQPPYLGTGGSRSFVYPSIDFGRAHLPISHWAQWRHTYVAVQGSILDALGPFTEIAIRDGSLAHSDSAAKVFALGFIVPRVDVELGVPDLTTHLVVGGGTAMRFYRATGTPNNADYCLVGGSGGCGPLVWENFELSLFVKYVP